MTTTTITDTGTCSCTTIPLNPPDEWFTNPNLSQPTPLTVTSSGQIYGHLAQWGECHIGMNGECVNPPKSPTNYAYYTLGQITTASGSLIDVGHITMNTGHAPIMRGLSPASVKAHYDDTGTVIADVACGEDRHGIWFAGALRPAITPEDFRTIQAASLSGDWRPIRGALELVAALAVNVPGFPIPRPKALAASGMVAINIVKPFTISPAQDNPSFPTEEQMEQTKLSPADYLASLTDDEKQELATLVAAAGMHKAPQAIGAYTCASSGRPYGVVASMESIPGGTSFGSFTCPDCGEVEGLVAFGAPTVEMEALAVLEAAKADAQRFAAAWNEAIANGASPAQAAQGAQEALGGEHGLNRSATPPMSADVHRAIAALLKASVKE